MTTQTTFQVFIEQISVELVDASRVGERPGSYYVRAGGELRASVVGTSGLPAVVAIPLRGEDLRVIQDAAEPIVRRFLENLER